VPGLFDATRQSPAVTGRWPWLAVLTLATTTSWLVYRHLGALPRSDTTEDRAGDHVWLYYWAHHTSTWWAALTAAVGTVSSCTLGALLLRPAVRHLYARSKIAGALVAVVGWAAWLCGAAFLALLSLVVWLAADLEGTQTRVAGQSGAHVLVTESDDNGYGPQVDVWRQETSARFLLERGEARVDPRRGPCTVTSSGDRLVLTCGTTSQTLDP
jgi:hypothetical protein